MRQGVVVIVAIAQCYLQEAILRIESFDSKQLSVLQVR